MSVVSNNLLLAAEDGGGYVIDRSLRFRSSASAYLNRTPASSGNRDAWTLSWWAKRGALGVNNTMFGTSYTSLSEFYIRFHANNTLQVQQYSAGGATMITDLLTTQVFRDPSAWYHLTFVYDSAQATASNRAKLYVNGVQITAFGTAAYPAQNQDSIWNLNTHTHYIGQYSTAQYFDGYLTEVNFIDGQALTPDSFGEYNEDTGVWQPKAYEGTYGTNGFYLNFSDPTSTTTLTADQSGNGNNWTANNISLTSGATYDSMIDTPTPVADERGNFCVLNPLAAGTASYLNSGNLNASISASNTTVLGTFQLPTSGKWYWEYQITTIAGGGSPMGGIATTASNSPAVFYRSNGDKIVDGAGSSYGATYTTTDTIGVAVDVDGGTVVFYKNNTSQGSITYAAAGFFPALRSNVATDAFNINFGQRPFAYTPPSGFKALHTGNLPEPAIVNGGEYFNTVLYTGNGGTQSITGFGFQPDFVWDKSRSSAYSHMLVDAVRGVGKYLRTNLTNAEVDDASVLTSFDSDGVTVGDINGNDSGSSSVMWGWKANGAGVTNTDGSITSTVSANPTAGFSIVTYTGNATSGATVGHGLGVAPSFIIAKNRSSGVTDWPTFHVSTGNNGGCTLNEAAAKVTTAIWWNNTTPSSTVVTLGNGSQTNGSGNSQLLYCFAEVPGYSKFGSYTGNGSADGPFVYTGFRPAFVMLKPTTRGDNWAIQDATRDTYNDSAKRLFPSLNNAEIDDTSTYAIDLLGNGFKVRASHVSTNSSGDTYIYMAFAENPFKHSLAR